MTPDSRAYLRELRAAVRDRARELPKLPLVPLTRDAQAVADGVEAVLVRRFARKMLADEAWHWHALWFGTGRAKPRGILDLRHMRPA